MSKSLSTWTFVRDRSLFCYRLNGWSFWTMSERMFSLWFSLILTILKKYTIWEPKRTDGCLTLATATAFKMDGGWWHSHRHSWVDIKTTICSFRGGWTKTYITFNSNAIATSSGHSSHHDPPATAYLPPPPSCSLLSTYHPLMHALYHHRAYMCCCSFLRFSIVEHDLSPVSCLLL